jgi:hypothetical protein
VWGRRRLRRLLGKLDRDLIRQQEWDYSATAFGVSLGDQEKLRQQVIAQLAWRLSSLPPEKQPPRKRRKKHKTRWPKRRGSYLVVHIRPSQARVAS